jgi:DNA polymerase-1
VNTLLLVDGHAYAYRAFHAIQGLRASDGRPTNAIFGFIKMLEKALVRVTPTHVAVIWDGGLDQERTRNLPAYKAQRPEMPDDLESQLDGIGQYLGAVGVMSVCEDGVEADDLIAALARRAAANGWQTVIASSDKDFMQLVSDQVLLLNPADKELELRGADYVRAKTGLDPEQVVDWLSLIGDSVDNIPGVPGVGPKTATRLLQEHRTAEALYARLDSVSSERVRAALEGARADVARNREMIRLKSDVPGVPALAECAGAAPDAVRLKALLTGWGFRSMAAAVAGSQPAQAELL